MRSFTKILFFLLFFSCSSPDQNQPVSYDPPGSTDTRDKAIHYQNRKTYTFAEERISFSNQFTGARVNNVIRTGAGQFTIEIEPENAPINNSAWYAFQVWAAEEQPVQITLKYRDGSHRYVPKLSRDGENWQLIDAAKMIADSSSGIATLFLQIGPEKRWVCAQELLTSDKFQVWMQKMAIHEFVEKKAIGASVNGRELTALVITENPQSKKHVLVVGRQHPPEITGSCALQAFLERFAADDTLSRKFRQNFVLSAVPLVNPDGVDEGHWRHNVHGVDLNRDWVYFNQIETQTVRDFFLKQSNNGVEPVYFSIDFHSTQKDLFYTLDQDHPTRPPGLTEKWLARIAAKLPQEKLDIRPFGTESPVSKTWFYSTFKCPSVTYEVGDEVDRKFIQTKAQIAAEELMKQLADY